MQMEFFASKVFRQMSLKKYFHEETEKREEQKFLDYDATLWRATIFRLEVNNVLYPEFSCSLLISLIPK